MSHRVQTEDNAICVGEGGNEGHIEDRHAEYHRDDGEAHEHTQEELAGDIDRCQNDAPTDASSIDSVRKRSLDDWLNMHLGNADADTDFDPLLFAGGSRDVEMIFPLQGWHFRGIAEAMPFLLNVLRCMPDLTYSVDEVVWGTDGIDAAEVSFTCKGTQVQPILERLPFGVRFEMKGVSFIGFSEEGLVCKDITFLHKVDSIPAGSFTESIHQMFAENITLLAFFPHGSRLIQLAIDSAPQMNLTLLQKLHGSAMEAAMSPHTNHVLQKYISAMPTDSVQFIIDEFCGRALQVARHGFSSRVLHRLTEHCPHERMTPLVEEVLSGALELFTHRYGNFIIQGLLQHGSAESRERLASVVCSNAGTLVRHWVSSNVVRCALVHCSAEDVKRMVHAIAPDTLEWNRLVKHRRASFIIREIRLLQKSADSPVSRYLNPSSVVSDGQPSTAMSPSQSL